jgi:molecular chaperone IbpA
MNELFSFKRFDPFTIGFADVFDELEKTSKQLQKAVSYPPYNIKRIDDAKYVIELAVAGFAKTDVEVTLDGNKLVVKGIANDDDTPENYVYKGIANRGFTREFTLADKVEIENAELINGMLKIGLSNMVKVQDAIKKIAIK